MAIADGINAVSDRIKTAANVLAQRGVTTASLMEELKAMGIQAFMSKVFTNHQAEDAMVKVLYILGTIESNKETIEASI